MADEAENSPLLHAEASEVDLHHSSMPNHVPSPPLYQEEAPPPYWAVPAVGSTSLFCGVCGAQIAMNANSGQQIVKCGVCQEATPISSPPAGKRFVRCSCHCLLICKTSSQRVACPRPQCKRVIELTGQGLSSAVVQYYGTRASCGHCSQTFLGPQSGEKSVRCPHCRKVSFIGTEYPMKRCVYFSLMSIFFAIVAGGLIAATVGEARDYNAIYALWTFLLVLSVGCACWAVYWARIKISTPLQS
ncbi:type I phosphatidylinositol 4,5-bisphosphate 4-phosphatase-B-like isoform X1 [Ictalurus furcatus]|uniref:type I phosphatidylinositol 4,5-bisphosphate 4-phosphatase-B-like isoform X1 n=1 Tax=Ictalurus furcatus TaxID=66913 RepID=UPI00234FFA61|nr:type I phosphatidylinositol 4,5-bisphosphate 4-phosphatase-B-like isoform X1 [Ictalurus furcatus]